MNEFVQMTLSFLKEMFTYAVIAIFLENTIFSRAIGTSTALFSVRKQYNVFLFGTIMTLIITASSVITYFVQPLIKDLSYSYYITPAVYVAIIGLVYVVALLFTSNVIQKRRQEILSIIHVSAFNCAVLGALC